MRKDSIHGRFHGTVEADPHTEELIINGNRVRIIFADRPEQINYPSYGITNALLIDNTGARRTREKLEEHLRDGIAQVLLTSPADGIPNVVYGVNHENLDLDSEHIFCAASCTTNAIIPPLKVVEEAFGIAHGHIETIHAYTNDQNLLDNFHKKARRGRAAPLNMVLTETGAAHAIRKVLPALTGKLTSNAIRVPTPNVSLAVLNLTLNTPVTREHLNHILQQSALYGDLVEQIQYSSSPEFVSSDAIGSQAACVFDASATIVSHDGLSITLYCWYDNEYGYSCQVVRLAKHLAQVRRLMYY